MSKENKLRKAAETLDDTFEPVAGTSDIADSAHVGYTEDESEERLEEVASEQGVNLKQNPDGSHSATDESKARRTDVTSGDTKTDEFPASEPPD